MTWSESFSTSCFNRASLKVFRYSPLTKYVVSAEMEYANVPKLPMMSTVVNTMPLSLSSRTSPKPTVDTVITVMYNASTQEYPSTTTYPTLPKMTTPMTNATAR